MSALGRRDGRVFVFGSNLAGRHGKGAALTARAYYGARWGQGVGRQGQSYAIPTKGHDLKPLALESIAYHVEGFLTYAAAHADERFHVTAVGCGLAGFTPGQIAPLFKNAPSNCDLPKGWREFEEGDDV